MVFDLIFISIVLLFKIGQMEKKIAEQRKKMGGIHNSTSKYIAVNKRKTVLENRLDKVGFLCTSQMFVFLVKPR